MKEGVSKNCIIEISSYCVRMIVGFVMNDKPYILFASEKECHGVTGGVISDKLEVRNIILKLKEEAESNLGIKITSCCLILPPSRLLCLRNDDATNTVSPSNIINWVDIKNVLSKVAKINISAGYKVINVVPYIYTLDDDKHVKNPYGQIASELRVHANIYALKDVLIDNYKSAFEDTDIYISDLFVAPLCASFYLSKLDETPTHYFNLSIGEGIMSFSLVHNSFDIIKSCCYQFGGKYITKAIQDQLRCSYNDAENYKKLYGICKSPNFKFLLKEDVEVSKIGDIIKDSFSKSLEDLKKNSQEWLVQEERNIPILLTGGTSKMKGLASFIQDELNQDTILPNVKVLGARNPGYLNLIGGLLYKNYLIATSEPVLNIEKENKDEFDLSREG